MENVLHHLGCPKCWVFHGLPRLSKSFWGIPSGAEFFRHQPYDLGIDPRIIMGFKDFWNFSHPKTKTTPLKINKKHQTWRFGSDDFPFENWVIFRFHLKYLIFWVVKGKNRIPIIKLRPIFFHNWANLKNLHPNQTTTDLIGFLPGGLRFQSPCENVVKL